eukprot:GFKZ01015666.1.p2 GENE.GFKZ01015666.1~~GFKZ01015666.1.p2  ORF type:complete len:114 (-),score=0.92 GFKZ01015666.1:173-514(-)
MHLIAKIQTTRIAFHAAAPTPLSTVKLTPTSPDSQSPALALQTKPLKSTPNLRRGRRRIRVSIPGSLLIHGVGSDPKPSLPPPCRFPQPAIPRKLLQCGPAPNVHHDPLFTIL